MRQKLLVAVTFVTTWLGVVIPNASANPVCSVGQRGEVLWKGDWYPAAVLQTNGNSCYIAYEGYDSSWNEWVEPARFRALFRVGDAVRILWKGEWYPGEILEVSSNGYKVTYDGYVDTPTNGFAHWGILASSGLSSFNLYSISRYG